MNNECYWVTATNAMTPQMLANSSEDTDASLRMKTCVTILAILQYIPGQTTYKTQQFCPDAVLL